MLPTISIVSLIDAKNNIISTKNYQADGSFRLFCKMYYLAACPVIYEALFLLIPQSITLLLCFQDEDSTNKNTFVL